jgi:OOP family OmpA-OmpF porin
MSLKKENSEADPLSSEEKKKIDDVRDLLVGPEIEMLNKLQTRIDDPKLLAKDVSRALPEAVILRSKQDKQLSKALTPTIEKVLKESVQKNPKSIADALFPAMGPAIRRSITSVIRNMVQSISRTIDQSFSWKGLKWRLEAIRRKKPFSEVVLAHTLVYRVEHVFLIHKKTGILLQDIGEEAQVTRDADMVSSMLTAIQDFLKDSLKVKEEDSLETMDVGNYTVWIENGPLATLACVIRGNPPPSVRVLIREILDAIHLDQREAMESFTGNIEPFERIRPLLEDCLKAEYIPRKRKVSLFVWLILAGLIALIGIFSYFKIRDSRRWDSYRDRLNRAPGIVVTDIKKKEGKHVIFGLRDPKAADPEELLKDTKIDPRSVEFKLEPYQASWPEFVVARAETLLQPPDSVSLRLEKGILYFSGSAPHSWIMEAKKMAPVLPGVERVEEENFIDIDAQQYEETKKFVEEQVIMFSVGTSRPLSGQGENLAALVEKIKILFLRAKKLGKEINLEVIGHASFEGGEDYNLVISQRRAQYVQSYLGSFGIPSDVLIEKGVGSVQPVREEATREDRMYNRSVTLRVIMPEKSASKGNIQ